MKSIKSEISESIVINKSEFITTLFPVESVDDVLTILKTSKKKYSDASHHCYAYIIGDNQDIQKYSDDGEPSKTAGQPMIEVLKKNNLTNILSLTLRYYGGIKLGAGGLTRAYTKGTSSLIQKVTFTEKTDLVNLTIKIEFDQIGKVEKYLRDNYQINNITYETGVRYDITTPKLASTSLISYLNELLSGKVEITVTKQFSMYL